MKFGELAMDEAGGCILAHSLSLQGIRLRKGLKLQASHLQTLRDAGLKSVIVARLDAGDMDENTAAGALAAALVPDPAAAGLCLTGAFTGRVNLIAAVPGVAQLDVAAIERFNLVHPMITLATVPPFQQMSPRGMVATIKVISYAVAGIDVERARTAGADAIRMAAPVHGSAGLVITDIPGGPPNEKGIRAISGRLAALDMALAETRIVPHDTAALAGALDRTSGDIVLILTGSATSDIDDVAPSALRLAGGEVDHFGMPVDPGNLLFLGRLGRRPVIGLPGCARSPALNGADWVLSRVACGISVTGRDLAAMGVGGLLKEIPTRPQPRAGAGIHPEE
jgi:molybdenum cofactor cytidylyltransferase